MQRGRLDQSPFGVYCCRFYQHARRCLWVLAVSEGLQPPWSPPPQKAASTLDFHSFIVYCSNLEIIHLPPSYSTFPPLHIFPKPHPDTKFVDVPHQVYAQVTHRAYSGSRQDVLQIPQYKHEVPPWRLAMGGSDHQHLW